jgi:hypothetical protein
MWSLDYYSLFFLFSLTYFFLTLCLVLLDQSNLEDLQLTKSGRYGGAAAITGGSFNSNFNTHRREHAASLKGEKRGPPVSFNVFVVLQFYPLCSILQSGKKIIPPLPPLLYVCVIYRLCIGHRGRAWKICHVR